MCGAFLELPYDLIVMIFLDICHEVIVSYYLFKLVVIDWAFEFQEGRIITKLLPMSLNDMDVLGTILLTIFLRAHEESYCRLVYLQIKPGKLLFSVASIKIRYKGFMCIGVYMCV